MNALKRWMSTHTGPQQEALAHRAGTSRAYLYRAASGQYQMSLALAVRLEKASGGELSRASLVAECSACPHRAKCRGCK